MMGRTTWTLGYFDAYKLTMLKANTQSSPLKGETVAPTERSISAARTRDGPEVVEICTTARMTPRLVDRQPAAKLAPGSGVV
jgi:hypothetical protein